MSPNVLVTGGSGFIGSWVLRELLLRGATPVVFDLERKDARWSQIIGPQAGQVRFFKGDLTNQDDIRAVFDDQQISHVIHLGALLTPACQEDPWLGCQVNVMGTVALLEAVRQRRDRIKGISYASSLAVFGPQPDDALLGVDPHALRTPTFYGAFKRCVEVIAEQYWNHFQVCSVGLRPHVVYGPEREVGISAAPSLAARAAAQGGDFVFTYTGAAGYDYVEDVARAFVRTALETPAGAHVVDLPSEIAIPEEIIAVIEKLVPECRGRLTLKGPPLPANESSHTAIISDLFADWQATPLAEGLQKTIAFYR